MTFTFRVGNPSAAAGPVVSLVALPLRVAGLRFARTVADVLPGSAVVIGSAIGRYPAKVIAWDFEVSDYDPIVTLELLA